MTRFGSIGESGAMSTAARSLLITLGLLTAALGTALTTRPFTSTDVLAVLSAAALATMAVGQLAAAPRPWTWPNRISAVGWLAAALVVATQPGIDTATLALLAGGAVLLEGLATSVDGVRARSGEGFLHLVFGLAAAVLGIMLLALPDLTVLEVAVLLGIRVLWFGLAVFWTGVRGTFDEAEPFQPGSPRRITTLVASAVALALSLVAGTTSYWLHEAKPDDLGALTIPTEVPKEPGKLVGVEEFDTDVPRGSRAWRILYTTTRDTGEPALSTALVVADEDAPDGPRPVIAWAHGTSGIAESCAPSDSPMLAFASIPGLDDALDEGWAVVATDYIGLGTPGPHPYLIGQGEGRSVLDSVRAARQLGDLSLSDQTVVWGHSQGGGAALWTGILAQDYAPEVDLLGVAGIAPASDLIGLVDNITRYPAGALFGAYVLAAYAATYPDVTPDTYLRPAARAPMRKAADVCLADFQALAAIAQDPAFSQPLYATPANTGALGARLRQNIPDGVITAPTFIAQGLQDPLVLPGVQNTYAASRCAVAANGPLDYRAYAGLDHTNIVQPGSAMTPELLAWTEDRFEGRPAASTC